ncbi:SusC/RagA family TonB-linked outer membrane protein [Allomuricauda sp. M10]|uniref:SusC/RagA family TonB-linked outer membrane protein n=1 Tax=Allomuricauda sp. M10 TaxID=2683292 RepID=UPI001D1812E7|nr:TonB-dependent receptor [Muricauda sp. M10]
MLNQFVSFKKGTCIFLAYLSIGFLQGIWAAVPKSFLGPLDFNNALSLEKEHGREGQQDITIRGTVTDSGGNPLPGASVVEKGTSNGVQTDFDGNFSIKVNSGAVLVVSYLGYVPQELPIDGQTNVTIALQEDVASLDEVVIVGYGSVKRSDLTSAISTVSESELEERVTTNPLQSLQAKVPGLNIYNNNGNPGGDLSFNIRGFSSINGSNTPLILVDGVITNNINGYHPSDFASVSVLKDASATAIYGARGTNGVILFTTKKGKEGGFNVTYDGNLSIGVAAREIEMLDAEGYMELFKRMWEYDPARGSYDEVIRPRLHDDYPLLFDENNNPIYNTNWQDEALRTAYSTHHHLSITSGTDKSRTGIFLGLNDEQGLFQSDYQKKATYRVNVEYDLNDWLTVGGELNGWSVKQQIRSNLGIGGLNLSRTLIETPPILPVQFPDGSFATFRDWGYNTSGEPDIYYFEGNNPVALSNNSLGESPVRESNLRFSGFAQFKLYEGLEFKSVYTNETLNNLSYAWNTYKNISGNGLGSANGSTFRTTIWTSDNYFTYDKYFNEKHHFNAMLGAQWSSSDTHNLGANSSGYTTEFFKYYNLGVGSQPPTVSSGYSAFSLNSFFGRLNYVYDEKYLFTFSSRYDGSSVFGADNKYSFFPSGALGWVVSKENFIAENESLSKLVSFLKLRGSYGITGNSPVPYSSLGTIGNYTINLNNQIVKGSGIGGAPNPDLKWERTAQFNIGTDIRMFNDRLSLTADWYNKKTTDLLFNVPVSTVSGYSTVTSNIGSVQNRGIELALSGDIVRNADFNWNIGAVFSKNRNKVLKLGATDADVISSGFLGNATILRVGKPMGSFIGVERLGTWGTDEVEEAARYGKRPGDIKRNDVNNDGQFDEADMKFLGSPFGDYDMTVSTSVRYKNWDMNMDIQIRQGNKIQNVAALTVEDRTWYASGYATVLKDAWTPDNQDTMVPALRMGSDPWNTDFGSFADSHWLEDGSFVRGRSFNLGYRLPNDAVDKFGMKAVRLYFNMDNFFLIAHNRDFDPEASSFGGGYAQQGQTFYGTPRPRTYTFGINLNF